MCHDIHFSATVSVLVFLFLFLFGKHLWAFEFLCFAMKFSMLVFIMEIKCEGIRDIIPRLCEYSICT